MGFFSFFVSLYAIFLPDLLGVPEIKEKALADISHLTVRELNGYLHCSEAVNEILAPFQAACSNGLFRRLWTFQCKQLHNGLSDGARFELNLDGVAATVSPSEKMLARMFAAICLVSHSLFHLFPFFLSLSFFFFLFLFLFYIRSAECASLTTRTLHNSPLQSVTGVWT